LIFSIILVSYKNFNENKITAHNFLTYFWRVIFLLLSEIIFDWVKVILIHKFSGFDSKTLKNIAIELSIFHEKLRHNAFKKEENNINFNKLDIACDFSDNDKADEDVFFKQLQQFNLTFVGKSNYWKYNNILDIDVITSMELENNVIIYCIFVRN
jgi:hypothetical protein